MAPTSIMFYKEVGHSQEGVKELVTLFDGKGYFDGPKPTKLLQRLITLANLSKDDIVLDFFSGSASTAHALFQQQLEYFNSSSRRNLRIVLSWSSFLSQMTQAAMPSRMATVLSATSEKSASVVRATRSRPSSTGLTVSSSSARNPSAYPTSVSACSHSMNPASNVQSPVSSCSTW